MEKKARQIIFNREKKPDEHASYNTAFRLLVSEDEIPFDRTKEHICLTDEDYPYWALDVLEDPEHYAGKVLEMDVEVRKRTRRGKTTCRVGRTVMTCCMNDLQFLGGVIETDTLVDEEKELIPEDQTYIHLTAKAVVKTDPVRQRTQLVLRPIDWQPIPEPKQQILPVRKQR